jgi:periplasmic divalent cation tolerance protein
MTDKIAVFSACAGREEAEKIARLLVEERLAACVNIVSGVRSFYRWKGALQEDDECLLVIKTSRDLFPALVSAMEKAHSYEVPEVVALPIVEGAANYLNWLEGNLRARDDRDS